MADITFAAALACMDGRIQLPLHHWTRTQFLVDYVDMITEAGLVGILARGDSPELEPIRHRLRISAKAHGSRTAVIAAHHDCAGNPVHKQEQIRHLHQSVDRVLSWGIVNRVHGLWINEHWQVEPICTRAADPSEVSETLLFCRS